jgi:hypothetical protein
MKHFISAVTAIFCAANIYAYDISLHAVDAQGEDEVYATCRIFALPDTLKPIIIGVADSHGFYKTNLESAGKYCIRIEGAGTGSMCTQDFSVSDDQPFANLGDVTLYANNTLDEVTVVAQRPLVVKKVDRLGYNVQADPQVNTISTRDMLRNVPMVAVDGSGNITVNGSSNFKVYKNGRPNNSMSKNAKDILAAIPASMIKTIEVITEPGAKYDAEGIGAILNIVTMDNTSIKGVLGSVGGGYDVWQNMYLGDFFVTTQIDKFTVSLNGGMQHLSEKLTENSTESNKTYNSGITDKMYQKLANRGYVSWLNGEGSWEINKHNLLTFELGGFYYNVRPKGSGCDNMLAADGSVLSSYDYLIDYPKYAYLDFNGNINYQLSTSRTGESLTASYAVSTTDQNIKQYMEFSDVHGNLFNYSGIHGNSDLNFIEHTFQADWIRPLLTGQSLEVGGKYILRRNISTNNTEYTGWQTSINKFKHITDVGALYAQYTAAIKQITLRAGIRYEYSHLQADYPDGSSESFSANLNDFVPSAAMSWAINNANSLAFNYATRINRPGIEYLNPTVVYTPTSVSQGNPNLESVFGNSLKLTYMFIKNSINFNLSADYSFNNDNISAVKYADNNGIVYSTYDNIEHERKLTFSGFMQWSATPKTRVMLNGNVSYHKFMQQNMTLGRWIPNVNVNINQTLPFKINLNATAYYFGGSLNDVYSYSKPTGCKTISYSVGLSRSFLKDDRLTVSFTASDFIGNKTFKYASHTVNGDYTDTTVTAIKRGTALFNISYRFGSLNASVKKTASSIKNDDLIGRK